MGSFELYMGIDVGKSGGIVVLDQNMNVVGVHKTPATIVDHLSMLLDYDCTSVMCCVEDVHSMPQDGVASAFAFGETVGIMKAALTACGVRFELVPPKLWQKEYRISKEKGEPQTKWKGRLKGKAQEYFPREKCTLWNADAFLIAEYCRRKFK